MTIIVVKSSPKHPKTAKLLIVNNRPMGESLNLVTLSSGIVFACEVMGRGIESRQSKEW
jgi:hypothetical protein